MRYCDQLGATARLVLVLDQDQWLGGVGVALLRPLAAAERDARGDPRRIVAVVQRAVVVLGKPHAMSASASSFVTVKDIVVATERALADREARRVGT